MPGAQVDADARPIPGWYRDSQKAQVQQKVSLLILVYYVSYT